MSDTKLSYLLTFPNLLGVSIGVGSRNTTAHVAAVLLNQGFLNWKYYLSFLLFKKLLSEIQIRRCKFKLNSNIQQPLI